MDVDDTVQRRAVKMSRHAAWVQFLKDSMDALGQTMDQKLNIRYHSSYVVLDSRFRNQNLLTMFYPPTLKQIVEGGPNFGAKFFNRMRRCIFMWIQMEPHLYAVPTDKRTPETFVSFCLDTSLPARRLLAHNMLRGVSR